MKETQWLAMLLGATLLSGAATAPAASPGPTPLMGTVIAWGSDAVGECDVPPDLTNAVAIAAGIEHSVALRADGTVVAWGADEYHQTDIPPGLHNVVAISTRGFHTLALKADGTIAGWGLNNFGQLDIPPDATNVVAIAAGGNHSMVLKADGTVECWGWGAYGETNVPAGLSNVVAIATGSHHSVAFQRDGTVVIWGYPVLAPPGLSGVAEVEAGRFYNMALKTDGSVVAWGNDDSGDTEVPSDWVNMVQIAPGGYHNLGLRADGRVLAFGLNDSGQCNVPPNLQNVLALAAGTDHSLALVARPYAYDPSGTIVSLAITQPAPDMVWSNDVLNVQGTAASIHSVLGVYCQLNDGPWQLADTTDGFADWSADLPLAEPTNVLRAYALDTSGNISATNTLTFAYQARNDNTLRVSINGNGRVQPNWVGDRDLVLGKAYHLKAVPAPGWVFYQWSGSTNSSDPTLRFVMEPGFTLTANFVPTPYPTLQGTFTGLFFGDTNDPEWDLNSYGALTLRLTRNGTYTGRISLLSGSAFFSGTAHLDESDTNVLVFPISAGYGRTPAITGSLQMDMTDPSQSLTGTLQLVSGKRDAAVTQTALFQGQMLRTDRSNPDQGTYNFSLDPEAPWDGPVGGSFGRLTLRGTNSALVELHMADQNALAVASANETVDGLVPVFAPLYGRKGLVTGWLQVSQGTLVSSNVLWFKPANASKAYYSQGFVQTLGGVGSLFEPMKKSAMLPGAGGSIDLEDGADISMAAPFDLTRGKCVVPKDQNTNSVAFSFAPGNGQLSGRFAPTGLRRRLPFKGVLISPADGSAPFATGYFIEPGRTGSVRVSFE